MPKRTGLIFACDYSDLNAGIEKIEELAPHVDLIKVGLEAMTAEDENGVTLATHFRKRAMNLGRDVMWDMKLHDIGNTVENASKNITRLGSRFFTLHAQASDVALSGAVQAAAGTVSSAVAVTVLTDLDDEQCRSRFLPDPVRNSNYQIEELAKHMVLNFARVAYKRGIRHFVCAPTEVRIIRTVGPGLTIITPGIRPHWSVDQQEQKRVTTPATASALGADYVVVGRPIAKPRQGMTSAEAARLIRDELDKAPIAA